MRKHEHLAAALVLAATTALAGGAAAQTTHFVQVGPFFTFSPVDIVIDVGDTVQWDWTGSLFHTVESGDHGTPDGIFSSGPMVTAPMTFSVTFDQAFLEANPVLGNVYDYFCGVHVGQGMIGSITVKQPVAYGCGFNPAASLTTLSGEPEVGSTWTLGVDNPLATQPSGLAFLRISLAPDPAFPCGSEMPGFGMSNPGVDSGELLIDLDQVQIEMDDAPWSGPGNPASFPIHVPDQPGLVGLQGFAQGAILGSGGFGLTNALTFSLTNR